MPVYKLKMFLLTFLLVQLSCAKPRTLEKDDSQIDPSTQVGETKRPKQSRDDDHRRRLFENKDTKVDSAKAKKKTLAELLKESNWDGSSTNSFFKKLEIEVLP